MGMMLRFAAAFTISAIEMAYYVDFMIFFLTCGGLVISLDDMLSYYIGV